jgi:MYXO-CTERM domain-containing protein
VNRAPKLKQGTGGFFIMKIAATLLGIAATVISLGATPQSLTTYAPVASVASAAAVRTLHTGQHSFLTLSDSNAADAPSPWLMALGFLGFVVLRRTRSGPMS